MPPIKAKSKEIAGGVFFEVEKAFCELQLADCNQKLARLRKSVGDYEIRNEELQKAHDRLDEDRGDIIEYLKKTLNVKIEENAELKEKIIGLEELREVEAADFNKTVSELERSFTRTKDQLTSENKIMTAKLNTLEEFRAIREDLTKKYERQQYAFEEQEIKYKRVIYNAEKKFIISKDMLKKEMEGRLLQLAQDFQDASELRIVASTHRVIRENIALNNQIDSLLMTQTKVSEQNDNLREDERAACCAMEVAEEERDKAMNNSIVQLKVIKKLTVAFEVVKKQKAIYKRQQFDAERMQEKIQKLTETNDELVLKVRVLEQNLHATLGEQNKNVVEKAKLLRESETFKNILKESAIVVQASLKMDQWATVDHSRELINRQVVLNQILDVINQYRDALRAESMESLISLSNIYEKGDLGFDAGVVKTASLLSFQSKLSSIFVSSPLSSSKESLKTVPSIMLVPVDENISLPTPKESVASFTVTSLHSSASTVESEVTEEDLTDVSKLLAVSRAQMQKSLMQDFALSQLSTQKLSRRDSSRLGTIYSQKSIISGKGGSNDIEGEHHKTMPEEDKSEHVQEKGESTKETSELDEDNKKKKTSAE